MIDFDEIMEEVVTGMSPLVLNPNVTRSPKFYWGRSMDLPAFLKVYGEKHYPLIWSVSKPDSQTDDDGRWTRQAELNLCTVETRKELLNTTRIEDGYSFKKVLFPLWEALEREIALSSSVDIIPGTVSKDKYPNYSVSGEYPQAVVWDVLRLTFTAEFSKYEC